jgi:hypothetical protein
MKNVTKIIGKVMTKRFEEIISLKEDVSDYVYFFTMDNTWSVIDGEDEGLVARINYNL